MHPTPFKYRAFLSYSSADARLAAWLHRKLEGYVVPRPLVGTQGEHGVVPRNLGRIFRDRDDARSAEEIETVIAHELSQSEQLIVLCTPHATTPQSWVPREIALFKARRPDGVIHAVLGSGVPPGAFPPALLRTGADGQRQAPLAPDLRSRREGGQDGRHRAVVRLVAGLLGIEFDSLWQREQPRQRVRILVLIGELCGAALAALLVAALVSFYRSHAFADVDLSPLAGIADNVRLVVSEQNPETNGDRVYADVVAGASNSLRMWVPASDIILRVQATYRDGAPRVLALHLNWPTVSSPRRSASRSHFRPPDR